MVLLASQRQGCTVSLAQIEARVIGYWHLGFVWNDIFCAGCPQPRFTWRVLLRCPILVGASLAWSVRMHVFVVLSWNWIDALLSVSIKP